MDKQFNVKERLFLMALTMMVLLLSGCGGGGSGGEQSSPSSSTPSSSGSASPNTGIDETASLEQLTLTAYPINTKGTSEIAIVENSQQYFVVLGKYSSGQSVVLDELDIEGWQSSDTKVGEFIQSGVLQGKTPGVISVSFTQDNLTSNPVEVNVTDAELTNIVVTPSTVRVARGHHQTLTATATYSNGLSMNISDSVTWVSDDEPTATVTTKNGHGLLSGGNAGSTTITAVKDGINSNSVDVEVSEAVITRISVSPSITSLAKGQSEPLTATATYSNGDSSDITDSVTWASTEPRVAAVTPEGLLAGGSAGRTTITANRDGITSQPIGVVVSDAVITRIDVTPTTVTLAKGQNQPLTAIAVYSDTTSSNISHSVSWSPLHNTTASITSQGMLSGGNAGSTTITAAKDGVTSNTVDVEVSDAVITSIRVTPPLVTLAKGQNQALTATATYSDNTSSDISNSVTWSSDFSEKAAVSPDGLLSGGDVGSTTITAIKDGITSNPVSVDVSDAVITRISLTPSTVAVAKGQNQPLTAIATYSDTTSSNITDSVSWLPVDDRIASVNTSGLLSGDRAGTTTLTAVKDGVTSQPVGVVVSDAVITDIRVTPTAVSVAKGQNQALKAIATYSDTTSSDISDSVTWSPLNTDTASITYKGVLSGSKVGSTTLTAVKDGVTSNSVSVDISDAVITSIDVSPATISLAKGQTETLTATATYSDRTQSDITQDVTWEAADDIIASISPEGLLTSLDVGTTTVTAVKDTITSNTTFVDVNNAVMTGLTIYPRFIGMIKAKNDLYQQQNFTAIANYSDGSESNVSRSVSWLLHSGNDGIDNTISVSSNGTVIALNPGTQTVSAYMNGFIDSANTYVCNEDNVDIMSKCIYLFRVAYDGRVFTSAPTVDYLDALGLGGSEHTDGRIRGSSGGGYFYTFTWDKAKALCERYNEIKLSGRTDWRLMRNGESSLLHRNYKRRVEYGGIEYPHASFWTSTTNRNKAWGVSISSNVSSMLSKDLKLLASCVSGSV